MLPFYYNGTFLGIGIILSITKITLTLFNETQKALDHGSPDANKLLFLCAQVTFFGLLYLGNIYTYMTFPLISIGIAGLSIIITTVLGCMVCFATAAKSGRWLIDNWTRPGPLNSSS
ncbi:hypothetical protein BDQ17DRAFT_733335 [Cyathus striatus]|nr:hypothetical protein BDQ17DRAFT_733335 [Cyathus striatus]